MADEYTKIEFSNNIFMYSTPEWIHEYPIVDIIKLLKPHTLIKFPYGKGSKAIKKYGPQYNHRLIGCDLEKLKDYSTIFIRGKVEFIFIFSDSLESNIIKNLINFAKTNNIELITYSTIDYSYSYNNNKTKSADDIMAQLFLKKFEKSFSDTFKEFELLDIPVENTSVNLKECIVSLNERYSEEELQREYRKIKHFDPHFKLLQDHKKEILSKKVIIKEPEPELVKNNNKSLIQKFFKNPKR